MRIFIFLNLLLIATSLNIFSQWEKCNKIYDYGIINDLLVNNKNIYVCGSEGLFISSDNGNNWIQSELKQFHTPYSIQINSNNNLFLLTIISTKYETTLAVHSSFNNGYTWDELEIDKDIDIKGEIYSNLYVYNKYIFIVNSPLNNTNSGIKYLFSTDEGTTWVKNKIVNLENMNVNIRDLKFNNSTIYATTSGAGLLSSNDNGISWQQVYDPSKPENWEIPLYLIGITINQNYIYVGIDDSETSLLISSDMGNTWRIHNFKKMKGGFETILSYKNLVFACSPYILENIGDYYFMSYDYGETWEIIDNDNILSNAHSVINKLGINDEYLFAVVTDYNTGLIDIYRRKLSNFYTSVTASPKQAFSISPLPSYDFITISGIEPGVNVEIFSLLGIKLFETLYTGKIDINRLSMGVYYVKVGEQVEKFVVGGRSSGLGGR